MKKGIKKIIILLVIIFSLLLIMFRKEILNLFDYILYGDLDIDNVVIVSENNINLNDYHSNIIINKKGEYTLSGELNYSVIVNAKGRVVLNLDGVNINSDTMSAIANVRKNELVINLLENSVNLLEDDGKSEYDGCIYSLGKLVIQGEGQLDIYGKQKDGEGISTTNNDIYINSGKININSKDDGINTGGDMGGNIYINGGYIYIKAKGDGIDSNKGLVINGGRIYTIGSAKGGDAGIDTDDGFLINGGEVIALGTDMIQEPKVMSKQKSVSFSLSEKIESNTNISLKSVDGNEVISFVANEDFKTLIVSNSNIINDIYYIYINGKKSNFSKIVD